MAKITCPNCNTTFETQSEWNGFHSCSNTTTKGDNININELGINFKGMSNEDKNEVLKAMGFTPFEFGKQTVDRNDPVVQQIYENGYIKNEKLHRRWITAQTMRLLGWYDCIEYDRNKNPLDKWTFNVRNHYNWKYCLKQIANECNAISHLPEDSIRAKFFTSEKIRAMISDYIKETRLYCSRLKKRNCKGIPYVKVKGRDVFVADIEKKIISPIIDLYSSFLRITGSKNFYKEASKLIKNFLKSDNYINLPWRAKISDSWIDMFKKSGAYYTMDNLVKYHGLELIDYSNNARLNREDSLDYLNKCANDPCSSGYKLLALLKNSLAENNFKFSEEISK